MNNSIADGNERFDKASKEDKRRMIAWDVIQQVQIGKYHAESVYFVPNGQGECTVCGIGACFASMHRFAGTFDKLLLSDYEHIRGWDKLRKYFGARQLAYIEEFFEHLYVDRSNGYWGTSIGGKYEVSVTDRQLLKINRAKQFFQDRSKEAVLIQIMENIIRNGKFDYMEEIEFQTKPKVTPIPNEISDALQSLGVGTTSPQQNQLENINRT